MHSRSAPASSCLRDYHRKVVEAAVANGFGMINECQRLDQWRLSERPAGRSAHADVVDAFQQDYMRHAGNREYVTIESRQCTWPAAIAAIA